MSTHEATVETIAHTALHHLETLELPTLRDQFAMAALTGLLAAPMHPDVKRPTFDTIVEDSRRLADGMMKAREED